jgi:hypothetical protein
MRRSSVFTAAFFVAMGLAAVYGSLSGPSLMHAQEPPDDKEEPPAPTPTATPTPTACEKGQEEPCVSGRANSHPRLIGAIICDENGNKVPCVFCDRFPPGLPDALRDSIADCVLQHESAHGGDTRYNCPPENPMGRRAVWGLTRQEHILGECAAHAATHQCLSDLLESPPDNIDPCDFAFVRFLIVQNNYFAAGCANTPGATQVPPLPTCPPAPTPPPEK